MPQNANSSSAAPPPEPVTLEKFTVDQQQRLEALNFASLLVVKQMETNRFGTDADGIDHSARTQNVLTTANAYYEFLTAKGEDGGKGSA